MCIIYAHLELGTREEHVKYLILLKIGYIRYLENLIIEDINKDGN